MILYRGINDIDTKYLHDPNFSSINCSINPTKIDSTIKKIIIHEIYYSEMSLSLDRIIGHISGQSIGESCWISTSLDFNFVATEYAIPQAGKYNSCPYRKNIIIIDSSNEIDTRNLANRGIRSDRFVGKYIDLSNGNLNNLVNSSFVKALYQNENSYYYDFMKNMLNNLNGIRCVNVNGFSNFATRAGECLFYREIPKRNIIGVLSPLMQDLIYIETYGKSIDDANRIVLECIKKYRNIDLSDYDFTDDEKEIIDLIYKKDKEGNYDCLINLIPYYYNPNDDLEVDEVYELLKAIKRNILAKMSEHTIIPLVDDTIYAIRYQNVVNRVLPNGKPINNTNRNDVIYQADENRKLVRNYFGKNSLKT